MIHAIVKVPGGKYEKIHKIHRKMCSFVFSLRWCFFLDIQATSNTKI